MYIPHLRPALDPELIKVSREPDNTKTIKIIMLVAPDITRNHYLQKFMGAAIKFDRICHISLIFHTSL
jgi:hypothetical protein